jgi:hypothetical protein
MNESLDFTGLNRSENKAHLLGGEKELSLIA